MDGREARTAMPAPDTIKRLIGRTIEVERRNGQHERGHLLNVTRRSLWLVSGDEDHFIAIGEIEDLRAAS
jgi:hypothetical protein